MAGAAAAPAPSTPGTWSETGPPEEKNRRTKNQEPRPQVQQVQRG
jgi:hypothetical protein